MYKIIGLFLALLASPLGEKGPPPSPPYSEPNPPANMEILRSLAKTHSRSVEEIWEAVYYANLHGGKSFPTPLDLLAVMAVESGFNKNAVAKDGTGIGLMQINPKAHPSSGLKTPSINVKKGAELLRRNPSFTAYNAGPAGAVKVCPPPAPCVTEYSLKVLAAKQALMHTWRAS